MTLVKALRSPLSWFVVLLTFYAAFKLVKEDKVMEVIRSDGRGYYAYLPALLIYNDPTYTESKKAEQQYNAGNIDQLYLFKDKSGHVYNKYFPGTALLQLPFFLLACFIAWISGQPIDGYSEIFHWCYFVGSLVYTWLGIALFRRSIRFFFPDQIRRIDRLIPLLYVATPLMYYSFSTPSFTHHYSFFLFGTFAYLMIRLKESITLKRMILLGVVVGLILLIRPTNITVLLLIPFLIGSKTELFAWIKNLVTEKRTLLFAAAGSCLAIVSLLLFSWKWQTGNWLVWSYSGEGFHFLQPPILTCLLSFRNGLFVHMPVLLLSVIGIVFWFRKNKFQALWLSVYWLINCWLIFSWWCWDYESPFGNRPFVEHLFFLLLPLFAVVERKSLLAYSFVGMCALIGGIRFYESTTGFMVDQRFTKDNFLPSLQFWKSSNSGRWYFTKSCVPFGDKSAEVVLVDQPTERNVLPTDEFLFTIDYPFPVKRTNERYYLRVQLEKQIGEKRFEGVYLIIDASSSKSTKRYYKSMELYNDREEGRNSWVTLNFESQIHDYLQEYETVRVYIWNQGKQSFRLRNLKMVLEEYN
ncbi:MAG: hypothetical protein HYZ43_08795 [Flavobacteriia bacterium]|nr:hypothetical protein [Flavobacteriia bacterium]